MLWSLLSATLRPSIIFEDIVCVHHLASQWIHSGQATSLTMNYVFEIFFEDALSSLHRNGLQTRQARRDMIDRLSSIISGCANAEQGTFDECATEAILAAIEFHQKNKSENSEVRDEVCRPICSFGNHFSILIYFFLHHHPDDQCCRSARWESFTIFCTSPFARLGTGASLIQMQFVHCWVSLQPLYVK